MAADRIEISGEVTKKRAFVWALDWPGWCRGGKDLDLAIASLIDHAARYAPVAALAGERLPSVAPDTLITVDMVEGGTGTEFGVPSAIVQRDRRPVSGSEATRLSALVAAAWATFDRMAARSPAELRKGPRGGGRDRDRMIGHVIEADHAYAREIGVRRAPPSIGDRAAVEAERAAMLDVLGRPSDGGPLGDRTWTQRYAARRIAWHALDHAWEMEDRAGPA